MRAVAEGGAMHGAAAEARLRCDLAPDGRVQGPGGAWHGSHHAEVADGMPPHGPGSRVQGPDGMPPHGLLGALQTLHSMRLAPAPPSRETEDGMPDAAARQSLPPELLATTISNWRSVALCFDAAAEEWALTATPPRRASRASLGVVARGLALHPRTLCTALMAEYQSNPAVELPAPSRAQLLCFQLADVMDGLLSGHRTLPSDLAPAVELMLCTAPPAATQPRDGDGEGQRSAGK